MHYTKRGANGRPALRSQEAASFVVASIVACCRAVVRCPCYSCCPTIAVFLLARICRPSACSRRYGVGEWNHSTGYSLERFWCGDETTPEFKFDFLEQVANRPLLVVFLGARAWADDDGGRLDGCRRAARCSG
jgi:hypothetical protein